MLTTSDEAQKELFLAISDLIDGDWEKEFRQPVREAYDKVWEAGGEKIYKDSIKDRNEMIFGKQ